MLGKEQWTYKHFDFGFATSSLSNCREITPPLMKAEIGKVSSATCADSPNL